MYGLNGVIGIRKSFFGFDDVVWRGGVILVLSKILGLGKDKLRKRALITDIYVEKIINLLVTTAVGKTELMQEQPGIGGIIVVDFPALSFFVQTLKNRVLPL